MVPNFVTLYASGEAGQINKHIITLGGLINYIETNHRCCEKKVTREWITCGGCHEEVNI